MRNHADPEPGPGQTLKSQKVDLLEQNDAFRKAENQGLFAHFCLFPCSWIQIRARISNTNPDPGQPNQGGSWIHNSGEISVAGSGCLSRIRIFSIPTPRSASKNLSILTKKVVSKLSEI